MTSQESGDARISIDVEVRGIVFDTVRCSAYINTERLGSITLASNFMYTKGSTIHWYDEASHGMCTHPCTKSEIRALYDILKGIDIHNWIGLGRNTQITLEIKEKVLRLMLEYIERE